MLLNCEASASSHCFSCVQRTMAMVGVLTAHGKSLLPRRKMSRKKAFFDQLLDKSTCSFPANVLSSCHLSITMWGRRETPAGSGQTIIAISVTDRNYLDWQMQRCGWALANMGHIGALSGLGDCRRFSGGSDVLAESWRISRARSVLADPAQSKWSVSWILSILSKEVYFLLYFKCCHSTPVEDDTIWIGFVLVLKCPNGTRWEESSSGWWSQRWI